MDTFPQGIAIQAMRVMKAIAGNDEVKVSIAKIGGVDVILATMSKHHRNAVVRTSSLKDRVTYISKCIVLNLDSTQQRR